MSALPTICTFESNEAPESDRWLAFYYVPVTKGKDKRKGMERLPITFNGHTQDEARNAATSFWYEERAKEAARKEMAAMRAANRKAAA